MCAASPEWKEGSGNISFRRICGCFACIHLGTCVTGGVVCVRTSSSDKEWGNRQAKKKKKELSWLISFFPVLLPPPVKTVPLSPQKTSRRDSPVILQFSRRKENYFVDLVNPPPPEVNTDIPVLCLPPPPPLPLPTNTAAGSVA